VTIERDEPGFDAPAPVGHPGRVGLPAGHPTGSEVDEPLPDALGNPVHFDEDRGAAQAVVVFYRSAVC
jgi:hypothetical protein